MAHDSCLVCGRPLPPGSPADGKPCPFCVKNRLSSQKTAAEPRKEGPSGVVRRVVSSSPDFKRRFELKEMLGRGAAGLVYKAFDRVTKAPVAIKFLTQIPTDAFLMRFQREAQILQKVHHPNVVRVIDAGNVGQQPYMVLEFVEGGTLRAKLVKVKKMSPVQAATLMLDCLDGLQACHALGVVHRDLKPENILLTCEGQAKISDLGLARAFGDDVRLTQSGVTLGTPLYMSPEQIRCELVSVVSDLYSMGVVLYELLAGRPPFAASSWPTLALMHLQEVPPPLNEFVDGIPDGLMDLVKQLMAKAMSDRPSSAHDVAVRLRKMMAGWSSVNEVAGPVARKSELVARPTSGAGQPSEAEPTTPKAPRIAKSDASSGSGRKVEPESTLVRGPNESLPAGRAVVAHLRWIGALAVILVCLGVIQVRSSNTVVDPQGPSPSPSRTVSSIRSPRSPNVETPVAVVSPVGGRGGSVPSPSPTPEEPNKSRASIPGGEFDMGTREAMALDNPAHRVQLKPFSIDVMEVTNQRFERFVAKSNHVTDAESRGESQISVKGEWLWVKGADWRHPKGPGSWREDHHPVVHVSWNDATAFCLATECRLPTEAEWERAARGLLGGSYPWGSSLEAEGRACFGILIEGPKACGSYSSYGFGLYDMAGNVREWCSDKYDEDYYKSSPTDDPKGPDRGHFRVVRGGSWRDSGAYEISSIRRDKEKPAATYQDLGFRTVALE